MYYCMHWLYNNLISSSKCQKLKYLGHIYCHSILKTTVIETWHLEGEARANQQNGGYRKFKTPWSWRCMRQGPTNRKVDTIKTHWTWKLSKGADKWSSVFPAGHDESDIMQMTATSWCADYLISLILPFALHLFNNKFKKKNPDRATSCIGYMRLSLISL